MRTQLKTLSAIIPVALFAGCAPVQHRQSVEDMVKVSQAETTARVEEHRAQAAKSPYVRTVTKPYLGSKSEALSYDATLPSVFTKVTMRIPYKKYEISQIAEIVTQETGLPVRISPDVFYKTTDLIDGAESAIDPNVPQTGSTGTTDATGAPAPASALSGIAPLPSLATPYPMALGGMTLGKYQQEMELDHHGSLAALLDRVASRMLLSWDFDGESINIYRFGTATFHVKAPDASITENSDIGNTGSNSGGGASYKTDIGVKINAEQGSVMDKLIAQLDTVKSAKGKVVANKGAQTIVVTDTKANITKMRRIVDEHNSIMGRQIRLAVRMITIKHSDDRDRGLDMDLLYSRLKAGGANVANFALQSPQSITSALVGTMGVTVTDPTNRWNGSSAIIRALDEQGTVREDLNREITTLNNKPAPIAVTRQFSYIESTTPPVTADGAQAAGAPGITQAKETVGFTLITTPYVTQANTVSLRIRINKRVLQRIDTATAGSGETLQTVQQPIIDGEAHETVAAVRPGETLLLSGYSLNSDQYDMRNLSDESTWTRLMGGSYAGKKFRSSTILLVTPYLADGA